MRTIHGLVSLLSGAALVACTPSDSPPGSPPAQQALATSFEVTATLAFAEDSADYTPFPESARFLLRLDGPAGQSVTALLANEDGAAGSVFARTDAGLSMSEQAELRVDHGDYDPFGYGPRLIIDSLDLVLEDDDGDGNADTVTGSGSGSLYYIAGDVSYEAAFTAEIRGKRDTTAPTLEVTGSHVLDGLSVVASEPLRPGSTARALYGDTSIELAAFPAGGAYVRSFHSSAVLPFDADVRIEIDPVPQDLTGLAAASGQLTTRTMAGPALFAEDGFESDPVPSLGSARAVTGVGTLPAIAGARSFLIEPGDGLTMRIPLAEGETELRFRARMLFEDASGGCETHEMRVGSPGVAGTQDVRASLSSEPVEDTGDTYWVAAGPIGEITVTVPAGASKELVFEIYDTPAIQPPCPTVAYLIDDLRAE